MFPPPGHNSLKELTHRGIPHSKRMALNKFLLLLLLSLLSFPPQLPLPITTNCLSSTLYCRCSSCNSLLLLRRRRRRRRRCCCCCRRRILLLVLTHCHHRGFLLLPLAPRILGAHADGYRAISSRPTCVCVYMGCVCGEE